MPRGRRFPARLRGRDGGNGAKRRGGTSAAVTLNNTGLLSLATGTGIIISSGVQTPTIAINTAVVQELAAPNTQAERATVQVARLVIVARIEISLLAQKK